jgi:membrane fusion protein (multidrug efflux system)
VTKFPVVARIASGLALALFTAACGGAEAEKDADDTAPVAIQIGQENIVVVQRDTIVIGPIISGELRAEREATVRAELGGAILELTVEEGQPVRRGAPIGRIEAGELDDARRSAEISVKAAENQLSVTRREAERTEQLVAAGALAVRDLDLAQANVTAIEAQLADARSRLVTIQQQVGDAVIRAPITGIVSDRAVNTGDVVTPGTALVSIVDPSSMRLEASVPSEELGQLRLGASVQFSVRGYEQSFEGRIQRISPAADPVTRQVPIFVSISNPGGRLVSGLFAEGRVIAQSADGLVVPENAIDTAASPPWALRASKGQTEKVTVTLGLRDPRTERVQVTSGLNDGDLLLRGPARGIAPGTRVSADRPAPR